MIYQAGKSEWVRFPQPGDERLRMGYDVDPLRCPDGGEEMKRSAFFFDKCQPDVGKRILRRCGLWKETISRPPPVVIRVAEGEPSYGYDYFERVRI